MRVRQDLRTNVAEMTALRSAEMEDGAQRATGREFRNSSESQEISRRKFNSGPICRLFAVRGSLCILVLLGGLAVPAGGWGGANSLSAVYSDSFTQGQNASAQAVLHRVEFHSELKTRPLMTRSRSAYFRYDRADIGHHPTIVPQIAAALHNGTTRSWTVGRRHMGCRRVC